MKHSTHLSKLIFATDNIIIEFDLASLVIDGKLKTDTSSWYSHIDDT